jgi:hypothetical protein
MGHFEFDPGISIQFSSKSYGDTRRESIYSDDYRVILRYFGIASGFDSDPEGEDCGPECRYK